MEWLFENWYVVLAILAGLVVAGLSVYKFFGLPTKEQIKKIKEWMLYAVTEAEVSLGEKTGILKLRMVYDMFIARFPLVAKVVTFETFSIWVDEALDKMKELLDANEKVKELVEGK